jgi:hypothetical protein
MMLAVPTLIAVTVANAPEPLTVATAELSDDQDIVRPVNMTPFASLVVAVV